MKDFSEYAVVPAPSPSSKGDTLYSDPRTARLRSVQHGGRGCRRTAVTPHAGGPSAQRCRPALTPQWQSARRRSAQW
eukprot:7234072-Prymnesium_polylepis.1